MEDKVKEKAWLSFKSSSSTYRRPSYKIKRESSWEKSRDWKLTWDEDTYPQEFLQNIYSTPECSDIVVWSDAANEVILIEKTLGDKSNISDQVVHKQAR